MGDVVETPRADPPLVLVIDDEEAIHYWFKYALKATACELEMAASGEEGLEKAAARRPQVVFLDLRMPGLDGVETFHRLRRLYPDLEVHIATAFHPDFLEPLEQLSAGPARFGVLSKPIAPDRIRAIVEAQRSPGPA